MYYRKKRAVKRGVSFFCASALILTAFITPACSAKKPFEIPESKLPTEEKYALSQYGYDELDKAQATLRADAMTVTKRGLKRAETQTLSNDFSLVYNDESMELSCEYATVNSSNRVNTATITFAENGYPYPGRSGGGDGDAKYYMNVYAEQAYEYFNVDPQTATEEEITSAKTKYYRYFKYMLMTQGQHLAHESMRRASLTASDSDEVDAEFASWLKKHPSADNQYGAVLGDNNAVQKQITLDVLQRSYHTSGLYLPAGEPITVKVEGLCDGESVSVVLGVQDSLAWRGSIPSSGEAKITELTGGVNKVSFTDNTSDMFFKKADLLTANGCFFDYNTDGTPFLQSQWLRQNNRAPWLFAEYVFTQNKTYTIGNSYGGVIHINPRNCYSQAKLTFTGAVETPHYILGVTTPEYFDTYLRQAPGVIGVMDTENGQLIGPTGEMGTSKYMRQIKTEEVDKLAMLWHSFLSVNESFTGGTYNRFNKLMFDQHVPAGAAVALGNYSFAHPTGWFDGAMNYRGLLASGTWGILHEVGHNHSASYGTAWGFNGGQEGEVRNNALTLLSYIMFCDVGTTVRMGGKPEHGEYANPYRTLQEALYLKGTVTDFGTLSYFPTLGMYSNIMHSFGAEKYYELLYTYKGQPSYCSNKRADFAYRCSLVYGMNFLRYFNDIYGANITDEMFTDEQIALISALPNYEPVSCYYAGGIDGVKTAGDYLVSFGDPVKFDLTGKTISTLDTAEGKGFEVSKVHKPEHGKISKTTDGQWQYEFNKKYTGAQDSFSFDVKLSDGIIHTLTVYLRISYNGARVSSFSDITDPSVSGQALMEELEAQTAGKTPEYATSSGAFVPNYNTGNKQVRFADFWWQAPVTGQVSFAISGSGALCLYAGKDFNSLERTDLIYSNGANVNGNVVDFKLTVKEGEYYAFRLLSSNLRRESSNTSATVCVLQKDGQVIADGDLSAEKIAELRADGAGYSAIPAEQVLHPSYQLGKTAEKYVFEPKYIISKKDNIKLSTTGTDKSEWTVVKAPENIVGGRYLEEEMIDETTGEVTVLKTDKWSYLIDGQTGTNMHTTYGGGVPQITPENPQEFVIDTAREQPFNFFAVTTRNNANSYITSYELRISSTGEDGSWQTVMSGDRESYSGLTATLKFPQVTGRYLSLLVKSTTGGNFSVLAEIDAGVQSSTQRVISSTSSLLYTTDGWKNSVTVDGEPSGYMIASKKNQKAVVRFRGDSFALYGATGEGYGSVKFIVDGADAGVYNLNSGTAEARKLILNLENLKDKEHTVEIITTSTQKVMLSVLGLPYTAELINAPNIYLERSLIVALVVFILLFLAMVGIGLVLLLVPQFREAVFGSKLVQKLDSRNDKGEEPATEPAPAPEPESAPKRKVKAEKAEKGETAEKPAKEAKAEKPDAKAKKPKAEAEPKPKKPKN